jgi:hypothetical protein
MDFDTTKVKIFIFNVIIRAKRVDTLRFINVCLLIINDYCELIKQFWKLAINVCVKILFIK